ncbi:DUF4747 family protein [Undibacterium sp. MH2W]|uniref:DUF4747 family protein n=1 Tax=Undibacterium sp. MH2W TaxID=3413044 RepID=UPI003BEFAABD
MVKESVVHICAINIAMHNPHSADRYVRLFNKIFSLKKIIPTRGLNGVLMGSLRELVKDEPWKGLTGEFYQFIQLDSNEPWFDLDSKDEASTDDLKKIVIPEKLKPHLARFVFIFFPREHRLFVQVKSGSRSLGPATVKAVMERLLADDNLEEFGTIEVTVIPEFDSVDKIFALPYLRTIKIELVRPNPDDHDEAERLLLERLISQNAKKMTVELNSNRTMQLTPDDQTKVLAKVASTNGSVVATGKDNHGKSVKISTVDTPLLERIYYSTAIQTMHAAFYEAADRINRHLVRK